MKENASNTPTKEDFMRGFLFSDTAAYLGRTANTRNYKVGPYAAQCFRVWMDLVNLEMKRQ